MVIQGIQRRDKCIHRDYRGTTNANKGTDYVLVDDSCSLIHVFRNHWEDVHHNQPLTADGRQLLETIPNALLERFCQVVEAYQIAGKFSIVPAPAGKGDIVTGIAGYSRLLTRQ